MTATHPAHSLGSMQRDVARMLTDVPMSPRDAADIIIGKDHGYAAMTLIKLAERGVALETVEGSYLYIRGPLWPSAAAHYGWDAPGTPT